MTTLSSEDLSLLLLSRDPASEGETVASLLERRRSTLPAYIKEALGHVKSSRTYGKQRFLLAVACALVLHQNAVHEQSAQPDREQTVNRLALAARINPNSGLWLGHGVQVADVAPHLVRFGFTSAKERQALLNSYTSLKPVDEACRVLLRAIYSDNAADGMRALLTLRRIEEAGVQQTAAASTATSTQLCVPPRSALAPPSLRILPIDGSKLQCMYNAVALGTGKSVEDLQVKVRAAVLAFTAAECASVAILSSRVAARLHARLTASDRALVQRAKENYLQSSDFVNMRWGTDNDLEILSTALQHRFRFVVLSPSLGGASSLEYTYMPMLEPKQPALQEIVMVHALNHYDLVQFIGADGVAKSALAVSADESMEDRRSRYDSYLEPARQYVQAKSAKLAAQIRVDEEMAQRLERPSAHPAAASSVAPAAATTTAKAAVSRSPLRRIGRGTAKPSSATRPPSTRPTNVHSDRRTQQPAAGAARRALQFHAAPQIRPATTAPVTAAALSTNAACPSAPSSQIRFVPADARPHVWQEIPVSSRAHFLAICKPMFTVYGQYSEACDYVRCADVLHLMLDMPAKALRRSAPKRLNPTILEQQSEVHQRLESIRGGSCSNSLHVQQLAANESTHAISRPDSRDGEERVQACCGSDAAALSAAHSAGADALHCATAQAHPQPAAATEPRPTADRAAPALTAPPQVLSGATHAAAEAEPAALTRAVRNAVRKVRDGGRRCVSRAARQLMQRRMASITEETLHSLRRLHPQAAHSLPAPPSNTALDLVAVDWAKLGPLIKHRIDNGAAPGPSGWTGSHLQLLADCGDPLVITGLRMLVKDLCNGVFTGATQQRLLACTLQPVSKDGSDSNVRPIAMGEVMVKLAAHYAMSLIDERLGELFPRIQFGVKHAGGSECASHLIRATLTHSATAHADTIALVTDFMNAFNSANRSRMWTTLLGDSRTEPIWRMFHWAYSVASPLLVYDRHNLRAVLQSSEGVRQGDPFAAFVFAFFVQPLYEAAIAGMPECHAVSIQDDLTLIGPQQAVFAAFDRIRELAASTYHLHLRVDKCSVFLPATVPAEDRERILAQCNSRSLAHSAQLKSLGVMHGPAEAIKVHAMEAVERHRAFFDALTHPDMPVQIGLTLLRACALPRLSYLARTTLPIHLSDAAQCFDRMALACFSKLSGIPLEQPEEIERQMRLPLSMGGLGLRAVTSYSHAAYFAALAVTLPEYIANFMKMQAHTAQPAAAAGEAVQAEAGMAAAAAAPSTDTGRSAHFTPCNSPDAPQNALQECWDQMQAQLADGQVPNAAEPAELAPPEEPSATAAVAEPAATYSQGSVARPCHSPLFSVSPTAALPLLWRQALSHARRLYLHRSSPTVHPHPHAFMQFEKLQHEATLAQEEQQRKQLHARSTPFRRALLTAAAVPATTAFLTALPTQPAYTMDDEAMRLAVRHRLGLPASDELRTQHCVCGASFAADPDHFHSCVQTRANALTRRHDALVQTLATLAAEAGWLVTVEPTQHLRPGNSHGSTEAAAAHADSTGQAHATAAAGTAAEAAAATPAPSSALAAPAALPSFDDRHGDLLLLRHASKLYIDLSVTRPTNASTLHSQPRVQQQPLLSTHARAAAKKRKYQAIADTNQYELLPFVLETYGGFGADAHRVLRYLSASSPSLTERQFRLHAERCLSVSLQRGNAHVSLLGQQTLHWKRQQQQRGMRLRTAAERARRYAALPNATQLAYRLQPEIRALTGADEDTTQGDAAHSHATAVQAEPAARSARSSSDRSSPHSLSFVHARLSCCADLSPPAAAFSDCELDSEAEAPLAASADECTLWARATAA